MITREELFQELKERVIQLRHDIRINLDHTNNKEASYWEGFADGIMALIKNTPIAEEIRRDDMEAMRDAWEAHGERRMGA